jgi:hypothetical protein
MDEENIEIIKGQIQRIFSSSASIFHFWRTSYYYYYYYCYCVLFYFLYKSYEFIYRFGLKSKGWVHFEDWT